MAHGRHGPIGTEQTPRYGQIPVPIFTACNNHRILLYVGLVIIPVGGGRTQQPMKWTPAQDMVLTERYSRNKYGSNAIRVSAKILGVTAGAVYSRAIQLGLIHSRERYRWLQTELDVVENYAHRSLETIQRKLTGVSPHKRTRTAIANQIARLRLRSSMDGLNHTQLAQALGVAVSTLHKWRQEKLIGATRLPSLDRHKGACDIYLQAPWYYSHKEIERFVFRFPSLIDLRKVDQLWFIELMRNGRYQAAIDKDTRNV